MTLLNVHIASIFFAGAVLLFADHDAFDWVLGKKQTLSHARMVLLHYLMWAALLSLIISGTLLFLPQASYLLHTPLFVIKLLFVAILVLNAILIGNLMHVAPKRPFSSLSLEEKLELYASGAISSFGWVSTVAIGLYLFY